MSDLNAKKMTLTAALAGAVALSAMAATPASAADKEKCYGVAKAGENHCASASGSHSCAGHATMDYDGQEWKSVPAGTCVEMGGSLEPFEGKNEKMK